MAYRRKRRGAQINTKLLTDVIFASLIVQKAPVLLSGFIPLDPMISRVAGIGAGWVVGMFANRPDISNASLALGLLDFINPLIDQVIGTGGGLLLPQGAAPTTTDVTKPLGKPMVYPVNDFIDLSEYTSNPSSRQPYMVYQNSY